MVQSEQVTLNFFLLTISVLRRLNNDLKWPKIRTSRQSDKKCRQPLIEITVSPIVTKTSLRVLDITWDVDGWRDGDWVELTDGRSRLFTSLVNGSRGWVRTDIQEGRKFPEFPNFNKTCERFVANYWVANHSKPLVSSCLSNNPTWMEESRDIIGGLSLSELFIPGTHDSAAFYLAYEPFTENRYKKYVFAQDESVIEQLIHGARYLDFRVGFYKGIWWLNHGIAKVHPLEHVLDDILLFLNHTKEIVVIDFHNFPVGFDEPGVHDNLVQFLKDKLKNVMASPWYGWSTRLERLWTTDRRLVVSYNKKEIVAKNYDTLWWPIPQKWPNVRTKTELKKYFDGIFSGDCPKSKNFWASMMPLTPNAWGIVTDKFGGLRKMADGINHDVTEWYRGTWGAKCNAVAVDFIRSTGIVQEAIRWNKRYPCAYIFF